MNKRKLRRANSLAAKPKDAKEKQITTKAKTAVKHAIAGEHHIDLAGNFIFFATASGDAWMLDHRGSRALQLAKNNSALAYQIREDHKSFSVKWTEKFAIENDTFIAIRGSEKTAFDNYPADNLAGLITMLKK